MRYQEWGTGGADTQEAQLLSKHNFQEFLPLTCSVTAGKLQNPQGKSPAVVLAVGHQPQQSKALVSSLLSSKVPPLEHGPSLLEERERGNDQLAR